MKKQIIAVILLACLTFVGCGKTNTSETTARTTTTTKQKEFTKEDYVDPLSDYLQGSSFESVLKEKTGGYTIKNLSVGSIDTSKMADSTYAFKVCGTFSAYDKYGGFIERYKYEVTLFGACGQGYPEVRALGKLSEVSITVY